MAYVTPPPKIQFFDANGDPLVAGKLYTYAAGTLTPKVTYIDQAQSGTNTNPVILDSRGEADVWLSDTGLYKLILKDSTDATIWTIDNFGMLINADMINYQPPTGPLTTVQDRLDVYASSAGSSILGFLQAGTGAVATTAQAKMRERVSVKDFGAVGNGVADDTAAIQAAINYCQDNLKTLVIPGNDVSQYYKITATLSVTKPITIVGDGSRNVTILASGFSVGQYLIDMDGTAFGTFEQAEISGITLMGASGTGDCLRIKNVSLSKFSDIGVRNCRYGIVYTGTRCFSNSFDRIISVTGVSTSTFLMDAHTGGGQHHFTGCSFGGDTGVSISTNTVTDNVVFRSCNFEQCTTNSLYCGGTILGLAFYGCRTEGCDGIDFNINPSAGNFVRGFVASGGYFGSSDAGGVPRINFGGAGGSVRGFEVTGNSVQHGANNFSSYLVQLNGEGESGTIANNFLNGTLSNCLPVNTRRKNVAVFNNEANNGKFPGNGFTIAESTFTFTDASGAGLVFAVQAGRYNRVGNTVNWWAFVRYPVTANGANTLLTGLPFGVTVTLEERAGARVDDTTSATVLYAVHGPSTGSTIQLKRAGAVAATNADCSGQDFYLSGSYLTTDA